MSKDRQWRVWAASNLTGVAEADRYCVAKEGVTRLIRTAPGADTETIEVTIAALEQQFPGPDATPIPILYLGMALREIGDVLGFQRGFEVIKRAIWEGIEDLPMIATPAMPKQ